MTRIYAPRFAKYYVSTQDMVNNMTMYTACNVEGGMNDPKSFLMDFRRLIFT